MNNTKLMGNTKQLKSKLAPYFFIAVAIFTALGQNSGNWV